MSSMTDVQVLLMFLFLDSKMAKQQLQKWELKFVTELEPLEGASPVWRPEFSIIRLKNNSIYLKPDESFVYIGGRVSIS